MGNESQINRSRNSVRVERKSDLNESDLGEEILYYSCRPATTWFQDLKEWTKLDIAGASQLATDRERWRKIIKVTAAQIAPPSRERENYVRTQQ